VLPDLIAGVLVFPVRSIFTERDIIFIGPLFYLNPQQAEQGSDDVSIACRDAGQALQAGALGPVVEYRFQRVVQMVGGSNKVKSLLLANLFQPATISVQPQ